MVRQVVLAWTVVLLMLVPGDGYATEPEESRPLVILLDGIGGFDLIQKSADLGFGTVRQSHEVRRFYWSHGFGRWLRDLQDFRHFQAKTEELAREVRTILAREPNRRIYLVAHSGGTGIAVGAAELLPPDSLERLVLLSSALSPEHDLRDALRACRGGIVSYHSRYDYLFLHWGTSQFGTIDRHYQPSAGYMGFVVPEQLAPRDRKLYTRLIQVPWNPRMIWQGNFGNHLGPVQPTFLAGEVAQWLR